MRDKNMSQSSSVIKNMIILKALSHCAIFLATCNAILLLGEGLANSSFYQRLLIFFNIPNICHKFTSLKSRTALQVKLHRVTGP